MNWAPAITFHQVALLRILAALFARLGLAEGGAIARLPRKLHRAVTRVLIPAESAVRRLIIIAALGVVAEPRPSRPKQNKRKRSGKKGSSNRPFQLFDIRKNFDRPSRWHIKGVKVLPRVSGWVNTPRGLEFRIGSGGPVSDGTIGGGNLCRRLAAIKAALEDLPKQAKRLVQWQARRKAMERPKFRDPMRPGRPPGYRKKPELEVDHILIDCHSLATGALPPDTS
jgi:hypothetical protein